MRRVCCRVFKEYDLFILCHKRRIDRRSDRQVSVKSGRKLYLRSVFFNVSIFLHLFSSYMLSAVAARKAALATQSGLTSEPLVPSGSGTSSPKPPSLPKNGSKRKPSSQRAHIGTKKPRKLKPFEKSNPRPGDSFKEQDDVIMVDSEGEESESAMSVLDDSEPEPISQPSKKPLEKRAWSPSRPADSSEDDSEQEDVVSSTPLDLSSLFPHLHRTQEEQTDEGRVLSTFKAVVDENLFYLDEEELSSLGLSGAGCLVALNTEETLCLLGVCALTVLHGSITVFGTTLSASLSAYPVYAPRSSPLPIIKPSHRTASVLPTGNLPLRLRDIPLSKTVIFIRELKTNVEGLGDVCRTFHGVFQPSGWQRSSSTNPFKIPGLSLVISRLFFPTIYSVPLFLGHGAGQRSAPFCGSFFMGNRS